MKTLTKTVSVRFFLIKISKLFTQHVPCFAPGCIFVQGLQTAHNFDQRKFLSEKQISALYFFSPCCPGGLYLPIYFLLSMQLKVNQCLCFNIIIPKINTYKRGRRERPFLIFMHYLELTFMTPPMSS